VTAAVSAGQTAWDFDELMRAHQSMVFSLALHFLRDREAAEEVAQEVFLSLHRHLAAIQSAEHAAFWLRKVTVQRAFDEGRRRKRRPQVALEDIAEPSTAAQPGDPLLGEMLRRLLATLAEAPRMVMILRYQEDLDPLEIAEMLDMPVATVKSHLQRSGGLRRAKLQGRGLGGS
jgi:RNA polymerase sigma-70 factor (ECF subfamily)